ncbi:MAG: YicC/YloC family endoribonuclease [Planctomycetaceae bacterium]
MTAPAVPTTPLRSMTGCGIGLASDGPSTCRVEIRSVNNRFFKLSFRGPAGFAALEGRIEAAIRARLRRGAIQVDVDVAGPVAPATRRLDREQLQAYLDDLETFCADRDLPLPQSVDGLLPLPGVLVDAPPDAATIDRAWPLVSRALAEALDRLDAMRSAEAVVLAGDLRRICGEISGIAATIAARVPRLVEEHRTRLVERVGALLAPHGATAQPVDVLREVALVADRGDVAEEVARIGSHVVQAERLLATEAAGRPLDFLAQEFAREANTIGSKVADAEVAHAVVELKTRIERLREQVQNIE